MQISCEVCPAPSWPPPDAGGVTQVTSLSPFTFPCWSLRNRLFCQSLCIWSRMGTCSRPASSLLCLSLLSQLTAARMATLRPPQCWLSLSSFLTTQLLDIRPEHATPKYAPSVC